MLKSTRARKKVPPLVVAFVTNISYGPRVGVLEWEVDGGQREGERNNGRGLVVCNNTM